MVWVMLKKSSSTEASNKYMKKYRDFLSVIGFSICFLLLLSYTTSIIVPKGKSKKENINRTTTFYKQPENSIDVLFIGASTFRNAMSPLIMWEEYGFTSYVRATSAQSSMITYFYLLESLQYQNPKVIVIDGFSLVHSSIDVDSKEPNLRTAVDPMRLSLVKLRLIFDIVSHSETQTVLSYLFPVLRYHDRWKDISRIDFLNNRYDPYRGQYVAFNKYPSIIPEDFMKPGVEVEEANGKVPYYHQKIIDLCDRKGINLIYLTFPRLNKSTFSEHFGIEKIAEENDLIYIDYALPVLYSEVGFDPLEDLDDPNHVNIYGAIKFSRHFGNYLDNQFDLPDRRNSAVTEQWDIDYKNLKGLINEYNVPE